MWGRAAWFACLCVCAVCFACASTDDKPHEQPTPDAPKGPVCGDGVCAASELVTCTSDCGTPQPMAVCGNMTCESGETVMNCPGDCVSCGDHVCTAPTETNANCPGDCTTTGGGNAVCGNAVCETGEDMTSCPLDCGGTGGSTCPGGDDVGCFLCWFDPNECIPPQTEQICGQCLGLGP